METKKEVDRVSWWGVISGSTIWVLMLSWIGISFRNLPPELPLFYSLPRGEQQLVGKFWFLGILLLSGLMFGLNLFLASWLGKEEALLRRFLIWGGVAALMLLIMSMARVMLIIL